MEKNSTFHTREAEKKGCVIYFWHCKRRVLIKQPGYDLVTISVL